MAEVQVGFLAQPPPCPSVVLMLDQTDVLAEIHPLSLFLPPFLLLSASLCPWLSPLLPLQCTLKENVSQGAGRWQSCRRPLLRWSSTQGFVGHLPGLSLVSSRGDTGCWFKDRHRASELAVESEQVMLRFFWGLLLGWSGDQAHGPVEIVYCCF